MRLTREPTSIFEQASEIYPDILITYFISLEDASIMLEAIKKDDPVELRIDNLDKLVKHIKQNIKELG